MDPKVEALIVSLRRAHPSWGPRTLLSKLRAQLDQPPSRSAIYRCLIRNRTVLKRCDHAKVPSASPQYPEEVGIRVFVGDEYRTRRR